MIAGSPPEGTSAEYGLRTREDVMRFLRERHPDAVQVAESHGGHEQFITRMSAEHDAREGSIQGRYDLTNQLKTVDPSINGATKEIVPILQESARKEKVHESFLSRVGSGLWSLLKGTLNVGYNIVSFPFKHPVLTALGAAAFMYWGVPWLLARVGDVEGVLASVPAQRMIKFLQSLSPLGGTTGGSMPLGGETTFGRA